jgi:flagellar basal-body rod protein FlgF
MTEAVGQLSSGIDSLMQQYMTTANNLANASTAGYKRSVSSFSTDLSNRIQNLKESSISAGQIDIQQNIDFSQGQVTSTGRPLDIALEGKGFLVLETPAGPLYTRAGSLSINTLGQMVDSADRLVAGANGSIVIPRDVSIASIRIGTDGTVLAGDQEVGKLQMVEFPDGTDTLRPVGFGAYQAADNTRSVPAQDVRVRQGFQESSNVRVMEEVVNLMTLSRIYESHMNILKKQSDNSNAMLGVANS